MTSTSGNGVAERKTIEKTTCGWLPKKWRGICERCSVAGHVLVLYSTSTIRRTHKVGMKARGPSAKVRKQ